MGSCHRSPNPDDSRCGSASPVILKVTFRKSFFPGCRALGGSIVAGGSTWGVPAGKNRSTIGDDDQWSSTKSFSVAAFQ